MRSASLLLVLLLGSCTPQAALQAVVGAAQCTGQVLVQVNDDLEQPDWREALAARESGLGARVLECALRKLVASFAGPHKAGSTKAAAAPVLDRTRARRAENQPAVDRATLWLLTHGTEP